MISFNDFKGLLAITGALGMLFALIAYYIAKTLQNPQLEAFAKKEAVEILISAVLPFVLLPSLGVLADATVKEIDPVGARIACSNAPVNRIDIQMPDIYKDLFGTSSPELCYLKTPYYFLQELFYESKYFLGEILTMTIAVEFLSSISTETTILAQMGMSQSMHPFAPIVASTQILMKKLLDYVVSITTNVILLLSFFEVSISLSILLIVAGAILRMLFFTRKLGGLLMALGLSLLFVMPLMLSLGSAVYHSITPEKMTSFTNRAYYVRLAQVGGSLIGYKTQANFDLLEFAKEYQDITLDSTITTYEIGKKLDLLAENMDKSRVQIKQETKNIFSRAWGTLVGLFNALSDVLNRVIGFDPRRLGDAVQGLFYLGWVGFVYSIGTVIQMGTSDYTIIDQLIDIIASFYFFLLVPTILAVIGVIATVKSLSPLLGGDVEIAGLTHFI